MIIQIVSDLHLDFYGDRALQVLREIQTQADVLAIAGDLAEARNPVWEIALCELTKRYSKVLMVLGNHDYYFSSPSDVDLQCQKLMEKLPNLHILENATVEIEGVRFAGTTLWFPKSSADSIGKQMMADFSAIYGFLPWVYERHAAAVRFLQNHADADVVITHHLPSNQSVPPQFKSSPLNAFFVAPVENLIHSLHPTYWIHGHTHAHVNYQLGKTRILANPSGYPYENPQITQFNPHMVFHVDKLVKGTSI